MSDSFDAAGVAPTPQTAADAATDSFHDVRDLDFDPEVGHPRRKLILGIMCGALILVVSSVSSLNVAIPTIVRALDATQSEQLWIIDAYALVFAGLLLPAGALGDRYGRKRALMLGLVIFGLAALAATLATNPEQLIALRAVAGIGAAFIMPATLSIITVVFPPHERGKAIAAWAGFAGAGGALGPLASGTLLESFWWGSVFFINVPIVIGMLIAVAIVVPRSREGHGVALDPVGAVLSIIALGSLVLGIIEGGEWGWTDARTLGVFVVAAVAGVAFVNYELRSDNPMLDPRLFRIRGFTIGAVTITSAFMLLFGMFYVVTLYLQFVQGHSPLGAAVRQLPAAATMIIVAPRSPLLVGRFGAHRIVPAGFVLQAAGFGLMSTFAPDTAYAMLAVALVLLAGGMAMMMPPTTEAIVSSLPREKAGVGSAVNDTVREVGGSVGIALIGALLATGYRNGIADVVDLVPEQARAAVEDSIGGAYFVASQAPGDVGQQLLAAAGSAYTDGMQLAFSVASAIALLTAVGVAWAHPGRQAA